MHAPLAAPPAQSERLYPAPAEQVLMYGLVKGLEGLLGAKPVPPPPKIACRCSAAVTDDSVRIACLASRPRTPRSSAEQDGSPRGQVVRLPTRARKALFANSVSRLPEPLLARP